jgi:hypothetical protein
MTSFFCFLYTEGQAQRPYKDQRDLIDLAMMVIHKDPGKRLDSTNGINKKLHLSASPILEYTLSTELTTGIAAGGAFTTDITHSTNVSSFVGAIKGYEQGRFIGKRYVDLESEFRFPITRNGLLGGVVFCNAASVSELSNNQFEVVYPGFGAGLRIKFNKFSNSNACLDYGIGTKGSRGFFGNLGEVF